MDPGSTTPNRSAALRAAVILMLHALVAGGCLDGQLIRADRKLDAEALDSKPVASAPTDTKAKTEPTESQPDEPETEPPESPTKHDHSAAKRSAPAKVAATGNRNTAHRNTTKQESASDEAAAEHEQALEAVLNELAKTGELDAGTRSLIRSDLLTVEQEHWEPILQVYRGVLSRRQQTTDAGSAPLASRTPSDAIPRRLAGEANGPSARTAVPEVQPAAASNAGSAGPAAAAAVVQAVAHTTPPPAVAAPAQAAAPVQAVSQVAAAPLAAEAPVDWRTHLNRAITTLESQASTPPLSPAAANRETVLRLLYLAANRKEDALRPVSGVSPAQQEFWSKELFGLATLLDSERVPDIATRATQARTHLAEATVELGELATLSVRNATLCSEVKSFGVYQKFDSYEFRPGQELLLYAEVENFQSEPTDNGFHTSLRSSYQILDSRGQRVANHEFAVTEDVCRSRRRDFIMRYFIYLPKQMYDGTYTLQLTIEDVQSQKVGQAAIEFTIKGQQP